MVGTSVGIYITALSDIWIRLRCSPEHDVLLKEGDEMGKLNNVCFCSNPVILLADTNWKAYFENENLK